VARERGSARRLAARREAGGGRAAKEEKVRDALALKEWVVRQEQGRERLASFSPTTSTAAWF
jgi:hypothetical protein